MGMTPFSGFASFPPLALSRISELLTDCVNWLQNVWLALQSYQVSGT